MHPVVFSAAWFELHQSKLLWLCNHWLTRRWFRWVLRIDCRKPILELLPHAIVWSPAFTRRRCAEFRTHQKYAKRIYHAFFWFWSLLHFWDSLFADYWLPRFSFGFATLTAYPDPSFGATTVDGQVTRTGVDETLATIRAGAGNGVGVSANPLGGNCLASATLNQFQLLRRMIYTFDTSPLGASVEISDVTFSLFGTSKSSALGETPIHIAASSPASNNDLVASDYSNVQTTTFGNVAHASYSTTAYNVIVLNADGRANIAQTGISKFSAQLGWDIENNFTGLWVATLGTNFVANTADAAGTANDPKLVVTYSPLGNPITEPRPLRPAAFKPQLAR
jgi:hypothetical protein